MDKNQQIKEYIEDLEDIEDIKKSYIDHGEYGKHGVFSQWTIWREKIFFLTRFIKCECKKNLNFL